MHPSFAAAALTLVICLAVAGTIAQVEVGPATPLAGSALSGPRSAGWEASLQCVFQRAERGIERLAGLPHID